MKARYLLPLSFACLAPLALQARVIEVNEEADYEEVLNGSQPVAVEFAATWCGVCNKVKATFEEVSEEPEFQNVAFVRVDIDNARELSKKNGIVGVPSFLYIKNGQQKHERVGVKGVNTFKEDFRNELRSVFSSDTSDVDGAEAA